MNDRFWAKVLFKEFIRHYRKLDDAQIVADVRKSMDDLEDLVDDADSFGSKMVRWSMERADQPFATAARENGKKGGRPKKSPQDAPNGNAGVDMYDAGNGAASKSPTSCDTFTADASTREGEDERDHRGNTGTLESSTSANIYGDAATREGAEVVDSRESGAAVPTTVSGQFRGSAKNQGESNTSSTVPAVCPESGDISKARQGQALESRRTGGSSVRGMAKVAQPSVRSRASFRNVGHRRRPRPGRRGRMLGGHRGTPRKGRRREHRQEHEGLRAAVVPHTGQQQENRMIITLNMDTEKDKEVCKKVLSLILDFGGTVDLEVCGKPREVHDVFEAARLRTAGEKVVYSEEPKKRGRPRKEMQ